MKRVYNSILECVGNTPLIRLNHVTKGLKCTVYAKVEFLIRLVRSKTVSQSRLLKTTRKREPSKRRYDYRRNFWQYRCWFALMAANRGYKATFVMPDKQSEEKRQALRAWGAKVVITPTDVPADDQILLQGFRAIGARRQTIAVMPTSITIPATPKRII